MRRSNHRKGKGKRTISIIVDGETEIWYFQMMKKHESMNHVNIKPELPKKKRLAEQFRLVVDNARDYDKVIWVVDFDTIIKEERERQKGGLSKIREFREYIDKSYRYTNIEILVNTPCLEFWYLLHFKETSKYFDSCDKINKEFKNTVLKDYQKTESYYKKRNADIYVKLNPNRKKAVGNSEKLGDFNINTPASAKAEIYKIFRMLELD